MTHQLYFLMTGKTINQFSFVESFFYNSFTTVAIELRIQPPKFKVTSVTILSSFLFLVHATKLSCAFRHCPRNQTSVYIYFSFLASFGLNSFIKLIATLRFCQRSTSKPRILVSVSLNRPLDRARIHRSFQDQRQ